YDRLFNVADPDDDRDGKTYQDHLNPDSRRVLRGWIEPAAADATPEQSFQFERLGYFVADRHDHAPGAPVFNRSVTLRDTWAGKVCAARPLPRAGRGDDDMSLLRPLLILVLAVLLGACAAPGTPPGSAATTPPSATDGAGTGNDRGPIPGAPRIGGTRDDDPGAVDRSCTTDAD